MKQPGPDHPITIQQYERRVRVHFNGRIVAESGHALLMREENYRPVFYIPRADADASLLERTTRSTYCPYKGDASYFSIRAGGRVSENAVWTYERPYSAVAAIKDCLAFYPDRVDMIEEFED